MAKPAKWRLPPCKNCCKPPIMREVNGGLVQCQDFDKPSAPNYEGCKAPISVGSLKSLAHAVGYWLAINSPVDVIDG